MIHLTPLHWDGFYLACFVLGLVFSLLTFLGGSLHLHSGHLHSGHLHAGGHGAGKAGHGGSQQLSPANGFTAVAFLCWFGGAGYLMTHAGVFGPGLVLLFSALSGIAGGGMVFWFFAKILLPRERVLEPADTPIVGVLGRVSAAVSARGVGEMLYSQGGARRSMPIAAEDGAPIDRDAEVVVVRYARGIAYVRRWDEMQQILLGDTSAAFGNGVGGERDLE